MSAIPRKYLQFCITAGSFAHTKLQVRCPRGQDHFCQRVTGAYREGGISVQVIYQQRVQIGDGAFGNCIVNEANAGTGITDVRNALGHSKQVASSQCLRIFNSHGDTARRPKFTAYAEDISSLGLTIKANGQTIHRDLRRRAAGHIAHTGERIFCNPARVRRIVGEIDRAQIRITLFIYVDAYRRASIGHAVIHGKFGGCGKQRAACLLSHVHTLGMSGIDLAHKR